MTKISASLISLTSLCLALACASAPTTEPEAASSGDEPAQLAAAQARSERLTAWVAENLDDERYLVPVLPTDSSFGAEQGAGVTFVVFHDYQCPYCRRLETELRALAETYPTDVRVVFKHFPLAMHRRARIAAEAVVAAQAQGRGQEMHQRLLDDGDAELSDVDLLRLAAQAEVPDLERFEAELQQGTHAARVDADIALGAKLGVSSTPTYFINGVPHRGAKSFEQLRELYVAEAAKVDRVLAAGASREEVYGLLMAVAKPEREVPKRPRATRPGKPDPSVHYAVPVDDRPTRGRADALVTIIEFADFECPYCEKAQPTLAELERRYGKDLRIVFRHQPLPMHLEAEPAARAAIAADRQGEFWAMHDLLFTASKQQLADQSFYVDTAAQLGLDVERFRADMFDPTTAELIAEDQAIAKQFGATGTPSFFINGRYLSGAQPVEAFAALIDEELAAAKAFASKHETPREQLYATMAAGWETEVEAPPIADHIRREIAVDDLPGKGKLDEPAITLVMCGDFDCPYTARGAALVDEILSTEAYKDRVGFYFLHFPLPMHKQAEGAHQAAIAAGKQGKFWEMHDLLFGDRKRRGRDEYAAMAAELGLDVDRFLADWASADTRATIDANKATCAELGTTGTPNFFVNGRSMRGAVPFHMASEVLDEELAGGFEAAE